MEETKSELKLSKQAMWINAAIAAVIAFIETAWPGNALALAAVGAIAAIGNSVLGVTYTKGRSALKMEHVKAAASIQAPKP
jgi:glycine cleavage system H lipoate-binding protein